MTKPLLNFPYEDEPACVQRLLRGLDWDAVRAARVQDRAAELVTRVRAAKRKTGELEAFLREYGLDTEEGLALMTLAEALLRIPDAPTADALIRDKMAAAAWISGQGEKKGEGKDFLVKAAGVGLSLTRFTLDSIFSKIGEPVIRKAMNEGLRMMGRQFVLGTTIEDALKNAAAYEKKGYRLSYDMLGEGARTAEDAARYFESYAHAIDAVGGNRANGVRPGVSVKLSALHPRYHAAQADACVPALTACLRDLAHRAANKNIPLTVDAEEVERLELSLQIIADVARDPRLDGWDGLGLAVQAYQKRAPAVIDWAAGLAESHNRRLQVRLVKGAYWDSEVKRAQVMGLPDYPVYTRKAHTDLSYIACAAALLARRDVLYPMFATHNAHTVAAVIDLAETATQSGDFEFQRLHGMGETLHDLILADHRARVTVYAPCGSHEDLLPYLVRRLLENGANSSFVNKIMDESVPANDITTDPVRDAQDHAQKRHGKIPPPRDLFGDTRKNSEGIDLTEGAARARLLAEIKAASHAVWEAAPMIRGQAIKAGAPRPVINPADKMHVVGQVWETAPAQIGEAIQAAQNGFESWSRTPAAARALMLERLADLMEEHRAELMALCALEAGKTLEDGVAEVREAVDFCRYYAAEGRKLFAPVGVMLPGPTGERNSLSLNGRGVFLCISPWNFPLAIFTGQVVAALMAGNAVIAKPAEQTPLIAQRAVQLMIEAGIPESAITCLPGDGDIGAALVAHADVAGVAFTGSGEVARRINRALAAKDGPIVPLIAETGGQNAMIVDSSALPEQVVDDVIVSAFGSAGQRCSALRVLYLQDDVADKIITMLRGAMTLRRIGPPLDYASDVGPVIDADARAMLQRHREKLDDIGAFIAESPLPDSVRAAGNYFAPAAYEIKNIGQIGGEVFGPILHVIRYDVADIDAVINDINATGYGLTFGLHTRIGARMNDIAARIDAGNIYVNRTMIGAVVGVQPFGGQGLSGTGPKAGGPHYLPRFAAERVVSTDTTRQGGNATLVSLAE